MDTKNVIKTSMQKSIKYICAILLLVGMSGSVWGTPSFSLTQGGNSVSTIEIEGDFDEEAWLYGWTSMYTINIISPTEYGTTQWYIEGTGDFDDEVAITIHSSTADNKGNYIYSQYHGSSSNAYVNVYFYYLIGSAGTFSGNLVITDYDNDDNEIATTSIPISVISNADCTAPTIIINPDEKDGNYGLLTSFDISVLSNSEGTISWSSTNTSVATVSGDDNGATVTIVAAGEADIICSQEANGDYCSGEETCTLVVYSVSPTLSHNTSGKELSANSITSTGASFSGGIVTNKGGADISNYGFIVGTSSDVTYATATKKAETSGDVTLNTAFSSKSVTGLTPNTTYYVRAFAYNGSEYGYSTAVSFTTLQRYAVTYKINDGSATADEVEYKDYGVDYTVSSDKFSRSGYTLVGWNASNDGSGTGYDKGATYSTDAALTLYAVWGGTVSFDANGGTESMDAQVVVNGGTCELPECGFTAPSGKFFKCWTEGSTSGTERDAAYSHTVDGDITFYAKWRDPNYTDFVFSCSELTLTAKTVTDGTPIFITSAASKTVRSQDSILIVGSGLTPGQALEFPGLDAKFTVKSRVNGALSVKADGTIDTVAYIFYNPGATTEDGLDKMLGLTVKVGGAKPKQVTLEHNIIGRHLPADFVIAAKNTTANKWYALPANMTGTGNPVPVEIAVDDINNPTVAYTAASNIYKLYLSGDKEKVQLGMKNNVNESSKSFALWANNAKSSTDIGKNVGLAENTLGDNYKWLLTQTNMSITNAQDAKYTISNLNNENSLKSWFAAGGGPKWGLYASGVAELRLIPASDIPFTEAYFVEWGQHGGVIEVDAGSTGINATSVIAHLGEATSSAITLAETKTAVKNGATKYNYTVNFGDAIDFAATESNGAMLTLEWKNGDDVKAMSNIIVPKIIAANTTINTTNYSLKSYWNTEVHVLPGDTLFVDANGYSNKDVTIKELNIYPNATVQVLQDTLKVTNLVLRNGWTRVGGKSYEVARLFVKSTAGSLKVTNAYSDWYIDYDQYYPIAVPWEVTTGGMRYMNTNSTVQAGVTMKYYDGASRAANVQSGVGAGANWKTYSRTVEAVTYSYPETLKPGHGYAMTARRPAGKAFSIIRMPLTIPSAAWTTAGEKGTVGEAPSDSHKDTVQVYAYGDGSTPEYAKGWNFIANPYMSVYAGELSYTDAGEVQYANIPDINFREYDQLPIETTKLKPSSGFLIQAPKDGTVTFGTTHRAVAAPAYRTETPAPDVPTQKAYIRLNGEEAEDMMGLIVDEQYTAAYEANADLQKLLGDGTSLRTYLQYDNMDMAFLAVNSVLAQAWIPVTVRIPTAGAYTYSMHYASRVGELEGVYLMDYLTGQMTNLLDNNYTFTIEAGTTDNRFALNAIVGERQLPTDMDVAEMTGGEVDTDRPVKFFYHDQVYILYRNCIYDATGKQVRKMNR